MAKKVEVILPEFEVTLYLEKGYEIKKVVNAKNEYEAALEAADYLSADFDLYWNSNDFEVKSVVRTN